MKITKIDIIVILFLIVFMFFWIPKAFAEDITWQQALASQISTALVDNNDETRKCNDYICEMQMNEKLDNNVNAILLNYHLKPIKNDDTYEFALKVLSTYGAYNHDIDEDFTDMGCELSERQMIYRINSILSHFKLF